MGAAGTSPADPEPTGTRPRKQGSAKPEEAEEAEGPERPGKSPESPEPPKPSADDRTGVPAEAAGPAGSGAGDPAATGEAAAEPSRRFPAMTRDTARPEGGGRAAPGDAPAPARQWPLLSVLCAAGAGLLIVAVDPFPGAFRFGVMLIGVALLAGAVLRWAVHSVGMLAVRSRFTDLITYGTMGTLIVLLAVMAQPKPWLYVPFLQDVVHFTIR